MTISDSQCRLILSRELSPERTIHPEHPRERDRIPPILLAAIARCVDGLALWPLFCCGPAGTGKTSAGLYLADRAAGDTKMFTFAALCELARLAKFEPSSIEALIWHDWGKWRLIIIDEVGTRDTASDHAYETLLGAIDRRRGKPLAVFSNDDLPKIAKLYDDRIASRLSAGTVVSLGECRDQRLSNGG